MQLRRPSAQARTHGARPPHGRSHADHRSSQRAAHADASGRAALAEGFADGAALATIGGGAAMFVGPGAAGGGRLGSMWARLVA